MPKGDNAGRKLGTPRKVELRYTTREFFLAAGSALVVLERRGVRYTLSLEELYQHFATRMRAEAAGAGNEGEAGE